MNETTNAPKSVRSPTVKANDVANVIVITKVKIGKNSTIKRGPLRQFNSDVANIL